MTARAVANLSTLAEYLLPFVKVGGRAVIYKGSDFYDEVEKAKNAIKILGGQTEEIKRFVLKDMARAIISLKKIAKTPEKYPRKSNLPRKSPL